MQHLLFIKDEHYRSKAVKRHLKSTVVESSELCLIAASFTDEYYLSLILRSLKKSNINCGDNWFILSNLLKDDDARFNIISSFLKKGIIDKNPSDYNQHVNNLVNVLVSMNDDYYKSSIITTFFRSVDMRIGCTQAASILGTMSDSYYIYNCWMKIKNSILDIENQQKILNLLDDYYKIKTSKKRKSSESDISSESEVSSENEDISSSSESEVSSESEIPSDKKYHKSVTYGFAIVKNSYKEFEFSVRDAEVIVGSNVFQGNLNYNGYIFSMEDGVRVMDLKGRGSLLENGNYRARNGEIFDEKQNPINSTFSKTDFGVKLTQKDVEEEDKEYQDGHLEDGCEICYARKNSATLSCGHSMFCKSCAFKFKEMCPFCRKKPNRIIKNF